MQPLPTTSRYAITFSLNTMGFKPRKKSSEQARAFSSSSWKHSYLPLGWVSSAAGLRWQVTGTTASQMTLTTCRQDVKLFSLFFSSFSRLLLVLELWYSFFLAVTIHTCKVPNQIIKTIWFGTTFEKQPEAPGGPFLKWDVTLRVYNRPVLIFLTAWSY